MAPGRSFAYPPPPQCVGAQEVREGSLHDPPRKQNTQVQVTLELTASLLFAKTGIQRVPGGGEGGRSRSPLRPRLRLRFQVPLDLSGPQSARL